MNELNNLESINYKISQFLAEAGFPAIDASQTAKLESYLRLLQRWSARTNLTSIRDEDGIVRHHFVESIACARALPEGIATLLDFGSGAGFPGIPIALCRPEIEVTLAESQNKKAAFLQEVARTLALMVKVHSGRAETLGGQFDCVTLRAVDRMEAALVEASKLVGPEGWLAPLTTSAHLTGLKTVLGTGWVWRSPVPLAGSKDRILGLARRAVAD